MTHRTLDEAHAALNAHGPTCDHPDCVDHHVPGLGMRIWTPTWEELAIVASGRPLPGECPEHYRLRCEAHEADRREKPWHQFPGCRACRGYHDPAWGCPL